MNDSSDTELLALITNEISFGFTFLETARLSRDSGHNDHELQAFLNSKKAYETAEKFLGRLSQQTAASFQDRLNQLHAAILSFKSP